MPIDEELIGTKLSEIETRVRALNNEKVKLRDIIAVLIEIKEVEKEVLEVDENGNNTIRIEKTMPIDKSTGKKISVVRRQEVYDAIIEKSDTALNA